MTDSMTHVQILGSKFWGLGVQIKNRRTTFCSFCHGESMAKKWLDSIEKQKRSNVCDKWTDIHTYIQTDRVNDKNNRLLG